MIVSRPPDDASTKRAAGGLTLPNRRQTTITTDILSLRSSLKALDRTLRRLTPALSASMNNGKEPSMTPARRRPRLSAKALASLVLQGRYMGYMRQLKP